MTQKQNKTKKRDLKSLLREDGDFLEALACEVVQEVLEAEMEEALGAGKNGRTPNERGIEPATTRGP